MAYQNSGGAYHGSWSQQSHPGQNGGSYLQSSGGYSNRSHAYPQPGPDVAFPPQTQHHGCTTTSQGPYSSQGTYTMPHAQGASTMNVSYPVASLVSGFPASQQLSPYGHTTAHYNQQTPPWTYGQPVPASPGPQGMLRSNYVASPVEYANPQHPLAPRMHAGSDAGYTSSGNWSTSSSSMPGASTGHHIAPNRQAGSGAEFAVPCPYDCGTVLTGVHAVGNMTRHLKSQNCVGSGKDKTKYVCPVSGCEKRYIRTDGLRVHLRKRHNISQAPDRKGSSEHEESGYS